jgi:spermidine/putrescine transport system substrate-binding protein
VRHPSFYLEVFICWVFYREAAMKQPVTVRFWTSLILVTCFALAACSSQPTVAPAPAATETARPTAADAAAAGGLLVLEWAGFESPNFYQPFIDQHPNVKVDYSFVADDAESFAKAQNSSDFDVLHPCANYYRLFVEKGLVQPIDISRLKNWASIYPDLAKIGQIDGKQYFVPWDWGYDAILVRTDKVKTIPTSWADLWNPEYKGHVTIIDTGEETYQVTALALGIDPYNATPEQDQQIKQKLLELKPNLASYWSDPTEVSNLMASGDLWVIGNAWNESYVNLVNEKIPVQYVMPKEKAIGYSCGYSISTKTKNLDLAYDYINARMDAQSLANMSNDQGYGNRGDVGPRPSGYSAEHFLYAPLNPGAAQPFYRGLDRN